MDVCQRQLQPEWMDDPWLDHSRRIGALNGLHRINAWSRTANYLWRAITHIASRRNLNQLRVLDVACGDGDLAIQIADRAARTNAKLEVYGCDISTTAVRHAATSAKQLAVTNCEFFVHDVLGDPLPSGFDIVVSTLFLHHLEHGQAVGLLKSMARQEACGGCMNARAVMALRAIRLDHVLENCDPSTVELLAIYHAGRSVEIPLPGGERITRSTLASSLVGCDAYTGRRHTTMSASILGLGLAVPEHSISQVDAANYALASCVATDKQRHLAPRLYLRSGVESRHSVLLESSTNGDAAKQSYYAPSNDSRPLGPSTSERMDIYRTEAQTLATQAAAHALKSAATPAEAITHIVSVSCSGFDAPGFDVALIERLGLSPQVARTHVGFMGCHGALNGLRVAKAFVNGDPTARILLVAVELCSLHYQYGWTNERIVSNSLFADGAAAVIVGRSGRSTPLWQLGDDLSEIVPNSRDAMTWRIADSGFEMTLSSSVPNLIRQELNPRLESWLARNQLTVRDIDGWAVHPGGPRILQACVDALALPEAVMATSYDVLRRYGNMSSPTVLFVLDALRSSSKGPIVALGFGPGLAIEACLLL